MHKQHKHEPYNASVKTVILGLLIFSNLDYPSSHWNLVLSSEDTNV